MPECFVKYRVYKPSVGNCVNYEAGAPRRLVIAPGLCECKDYDTYADAENAATAYSRDLGASRIDVLLYRHDAGNDPRLLHWSALTEMGTR